MSTYEYFLEANDFHCKYAKGKPAVYGREFHAYDEVVLFLGGNAKFVSKDTQTVLQPGDVVWISKEQFHQFIVLNEESYERLIVAIKKSAPPLPLICEMTSNTVSISQPNEAVRGIFANMMGAITGTLSSEEKVVLLRALITQLLFEKKQSLDMTVKSVTDPSSLVSRAISYIDTHLQTALALSDIAKALNVSESTLSHTFRKEVDMSVFSYVSKKRVSVARQYIASGYSISQAAMLSGFNDYGSFFRICKKHYGVKPSQLVDLHMTGLSRGSESDT
ncbi:MAG: helix-turn-helix domain-containing protein [Clostridia bacterium]|nr:helix-turn-helix domain-containing protein [Clostridia bacterium]